MLYEEIRSCDIKFMVYLSGKSKEEIANIMGVSERTFYRYMKPDFNGNKQPILMATGNLGAIDYEWTNWRIKQGKLMTPSGETLHCSEILSLRYLQNLAYSTLGRQISEPWALIRNSANDAPRTKPQLRIVKDDGLAGGDRANIKDGS